MVHRLINPPQIKHNYTKEAGTIKQISISNRHTASLIDKLILKNTTYRRSKDHEKPKYTCTEDSEILYNTLRKQVKQNGITLSYKTRNNLEKSLNTNNRYNLTGVYKPKCSTCNDYYVGQMFITR